jgi:hypothetical protein
MAERLVRRKPVRGLVRDIDKYEYGKFNVVIPIDFDKNRGVFSAEYSGKQFSSPTVAELKKNLFEFVQKTLSLPWVPIIEVKIHGKAYTLASVLADKLHNDESYQRRHERVDAALIMDAKRYWIAQRADGKWMQCSIWESRDFEADGVEDKHEFLGTSNRRINARDFYPGNNEKGFSLPFSKKAPFEGNLHYLPYSESVWIAINAIGDKMRSMHEQLSSLVSTDEGRLKLEMFAQKMLPGKVSNEGIDT